MYTRKNRKKTVKLLALSAVMGVMLVGGCSQQKVRMGYAQVDRVEGAILVFNEAGMGASDALGHSLYIEDGFRFAGAEMVYEMAAAEDPTFQYDVMLGTLGPVAGPEQAVVSGEENLRLKAIEGALAAETNTENINE